VVHNWGLKLLAVVLAALCFYAIRGTRSAEITHDEIPVLVEVDSGIAILDQEPRTVSVTYRGSKEDLLRLDRKQMQVVVRPKASSPDGAEKVLLLPRNVQHGVSGVTVVDIEPEGVALVFDREIEKTVPVAKPEISGKPLMGNAEIEYEPRSVVVRGPKRALDLHKFLKTEPVDIEGRAASFSRKVRVLPPGDGAVSEIEPPEVTVEVNIATETVSREWTNVAVFALIKQTPGMLITFEPGAANVSLHGSKEALDAIPPGSMKVFVDCVKVKPSGTRQLPLHVHLPSGIEVSATVEPETVKVSFRKPAKPEEADSSRPGKRETE